MLEPASPADRLASVSPMDPEGKAGVEAPGLDARSKTILDFERDWWRHPGTKERRVRESLGLSSTRYHQLLNRIIDLPEAIAYDPMLVRRLRRLREERRRKRFARRLGVEV